MDRAMDHFSRLLPDQLPVGASYVVEGYGGESGNLRVISRYVLMPDGSRINVPADFGLPAARRRFLATAQPLAAQGEKPPARDPKKIFNGARNTPTVATLIYSAPGEAPQPLTLNHPALEPRPL